MLVKSADAVCQSEIIRKALAMLELIDRSAEDNLIFNHVSLMLEDYDEKKAEKEQLLCSLISLILGSFSTHLSSDDALSTQIKMLQFRLMAPITQPENVALQHYVESCADLITQKKNVSSTKIQSTLEPLLNSFGLDIKKSFDEAGENPEASQQAKTENLSLSLVDKMSSSDGYNQNCWEMDVSEFGKSLKQLFSSNYLTNSIEQSEKFGVLLEVELASLKHLDDADSFENKKSYVLGELEKVLESHQEMTGHFQKMSEFISVVQKDSLLLNEELDRVTLLSLTDELTELPNRRAFLRRLKDEVGRVKRYGHNLSLAVLDLDYFKPINDKYGHAIGDKVLKAYSSEVLSGFREQDMVARYGGEEFVVIFPNTAIPGALQALNMVQERTETAVLTVDGDNIELPTFSAGLISYQRADQALYDAKNKGRNRIEVKFSEAEIS